MLYHYLLTYKLKKNCIVFPDTLQDYIINDKFIFQLNWFNLHKNPNDIFY